MTRKYYAFEYFSGPNTTTDEPNPYTGRLSIAGGLYVSYSRADRDAWVSQGRWTYDMGGNCRRAITAKEARKLYAGLTQPEYDEAVWCAIE